MIMLIHNIYPMWR